MIFLVTLLLSSTYLEAASFTALKTLFAKNGVTVNVETALIPHADCTDEGCRHYRLAAYARGNKNPFWKSRNQDSNEFKVETAAAQGKTFLGMSGSDGDWSWYHVVRVDGGNLFKEFYQEQDYGFGFISMKGLGEKVEVRITYPGRKQDYFQNTSYVPRDVEQHRKACEKRLPAHQLVLQFGWESKIGKFVSAGMECLPK